VERAAADEAHRRPAVVAPDGDLTRRTAKDLLRAPVVAWRVHGLRLARKQLHAVGFDQQVDHERAAGLPLAVQAVAAVDEERIRREPVANRAAGTAALHGTKSAGSSARPDELRFLR